MNMRIIKKYNPLFLGAHASWTDDNDFKEYTDDEILPLEVRRLIDQESKQILIIPSGRNRNNKFGE